MTTEDLDRLEALHGAAAKGEMQYGIRRDGSAWLSIGDWRRGPHIEGDVYMDANDLDYLAAAHNALPALIAEVRRLRAEIDRIDKEADVERDVQNACDTTVYEAVKRVTGRRDYHSPMEAVEDLARECERLREPEEVQSEIARLLRGPEGV